LVFVSSVTIRLEDAKMLLVLKDRIGDAGWAQIRTLKAAGYDISLIARSK